MKSYLERFELLVGKESIAKIKRVNVIIFGVGGVGAAVAEMLVRCGVLNISLVDPDKVDVTNINRQIFSSKDNIGKLKVVELGKCLKKINPMVEMQLIRTEFSQKNLKKFNFNSYDIIIDCIDSIAEKKLLIMQAKEHKKYIICAMGAGNRYGIPHFECTNIHKTVYDPIAKIIRKFCVENKIKKLDVVYTKEKSIKTNTNFVGSAVYYPWNMATIIAAVVINKIIKGEN